LRRRVLHLVMDFRLDIVETRLKEIQRMLQQVGGDSLRMMELLKEHKDTKELRDALAKKLGSDLLV
ncbi:MAG: DNA primase, partial [Prevotella sp.]|nr:DNA primase [Prevotella sp.]